MTPVIRFRDTRDSKAASAYFSKADGGYYLDGSDLRREIGGIGADHLGLDQIDFQQFSRLLQGLDPHSGNQLTAKLVEGRLAGWDIPATIPNGVTIAIERGDSRVHDALWEAGRETMADLERFITTRERKGGAQENRTTGNMIWYDFEHPETRPCVPD
jgi:conjugative relaxase-like TrwC/TraI family protein